MISTDMSGSPGPRATGAHAPAGPALYPISLRLVGRPCLVVGGGDVAGRKVASLTAAGGQVCVVAPRLGRLLSAEQAASVAAWEWREREFEDTDVRGNLVVIAATDDVALNARVAAAARREGALVNVVDSPEECDFFVPAVVQRGLFQLAVSTGGSAPGLAGRLRERLETEFPAEWAGAVEALADARRRVLGLSELEPATRREALRGLAALDIQALLDDGGEARVAQAAEATIDEVVERCTSPRSE